jgi:Flp pilus assembly pilin Flp
MLKLFTEAQTRIAALYANLQNEDGQTMAEYAVVLAVIALGILFALTALSGGISNALNNVKAILP